MLSAIFEQFIAESPVTVMARGLMEQVFSPERIDGLFEKVAQRQYQQELLFSSQVNLMSLVVCGIHPSVHAAKPLPGKALVVLDPSRQLVIDVFPCEDAYTQERALLPEVLETVEAQDVWVADRNFSTGEFLTCLAARQAYFVIRQHGCLKWHPLSELQPVGQTETGQLFEQSVDIHYGERVLSCRRVLLKLFRPTRDGDEELAILTNLPQEDARAVLVAQLYQRRWRIEILFQTVTENFQGEIKTLAYPKAALFSYCMALIAYNILATLKVALASVHGVGKVEAGLSDFYLVDEIQGTYRGMMIAIAAPQWQPISSYGLEQMAQWLQHCAAQVQLKRFLKTPRGAKKKRKPLIIDRKHRHRSTARLLADFSHG